MDDAIGTQARALLAQLTLGEKVRMMSGSTEFYPGLVDMMWGGYGKHTWDAGAVERLGIAGLKFVDGPRGVVMEGATTFPVSMARGATWDAELEERVGEAIGAEVRALGGNLFGGVCINLLRHPAWGRAQETYGEDPCHLGDFAAALVRGVQRQAMACVKHYALNSMENARFQVDATIDARALHEVYLPHFRRAVEAGVACVMSSYNSVNGEYCGQNAALLNGILKGRWNFQGFVITDFIFGLRDGRKAVLAGQDVEMPFPNKVAPKLERMVEAGEVPLARVDDAVLRLLTQQLRFAASAPQPIDHTKHRALAREAAEKSIVLLKNDGLLPLAGVSRLAVIGRLAAVANTGDGGSSNTRPEYVVTPLEGLRKALAGSCEISHDDGGDPRRAAQVAANADAVVLVVGYTHADEGEFIAPDQTLAKQLFPRPRLRDLPKLVRMMLAMRKSPTGGGFSPGGDRTRLTLRPEDEALIETVAAANPRCVVAVMAGSAVLMERWRDRVPAILMLWYPGMEGGHAFADVLTGRVNPSGRLPFVVPRRAEDLPYFDKDAKAITYDLWHGHHKLERDGVAPAFPFGFGLSYTQFVFRDLAVIRDGGQLRVSLIVDNRGDHAGDDVVQIYVRALQSSVERPARELKAFQRVSIAAGASAAVEIEIPSSGSPTSILRATNSRRAHRVRLPRRAPFAGCRRIELPAAPAVKPGGELSHEARSLVAQAPGLPRATLVSTHPSSRFTPNAPCAAPAPLHLGYKIHRIPHRNPLNLHLECNRDSREAWRGYGMIQTGLAGKVVIVTGAASGIGRATALRFAQEGARVAAWDRSHDASLEAELVAAGGEALVAQRRRHRRRRGRRAVEAVVERWGAVHVLVNNAGVLRDGMLIKYKDGAVQSLMSDEQFDAVVDVNLKGVFVCTRAVTPSMIAAGGGTILNASSRRRAVRQLRPDELRRHQVRRHRHDQSLGARTRQPRDPRQRRRTRLHRYGDGSPACPTRFCERMEAGTPLGRLGAPEDVANAYRLAGLRRGLVRPAARWSACDGGVVTGNPRFERMDIGR